MRLVGGDPRPTGMLEPAVGDAAAAGVWRGTPFTEPVAFAPAVRLGTAPSFGTPSLLSAATTAATQADASPAPHGVLSSAQSLRLSTRERKLEALALERQRNWGTLGNSWLVKNVFSSWRTLLVFKMSATPSQVSQHEAHLLTKLQQSLDETAWQQRLRQRQLVMKTSMMTACMRHSSFEATLLKRWVFAIMHSVVSEARLTRRLAELEWQKTKELSDLEGRLEGVYSARLSDLEGQHARSIVDMRSRHESLVSELRQKHSSQYTELDEQASTKIERLNGQIAATENHHARMLSELDAQHGMRVLALERELEVTREAGRVETIRVQQACHASLRSRAFSVVSSRAAHIEGELRVAAFGAWVRVAEVARLERGWDTRAREEAASLDHDWRLRLKSCEEALNARLSASELELDQLSQRFELQVQQITLERDAKLALERDLHFTRRSRIEGMHSRARSCALAKERGKHLKVLGLFWSLWVRVRDTLLHEKRMEQRLHERGLEIERDWRHRMQQADDRTKKAEEAGQRSLRDLERNLRSEMEDKEMDWKTRLRSMEDEHHVTVRGLREEHRRAELDWNSRFHQMREERDAKVHEVEREGARAVRESETNHMRDKREWEQRCAEWEQNYRRLQLDKDAEIRRLRASFKSSAQRRAHAAVDRLRLLFQHGLLATTFTAWSHLRANSYYMRSRARVVATLQQGYADMQVTQGLRGLVSSILAAWGRVAQAEANNRRLDGRLRETSREHEIKLRDLVVMRDRMQADHTRQLEALELRLRELSSRGAAVLHARGEHASRALTATRTRKFMSMIFDAWCHFVAQAMADRKMSAEDGLRLQLQEALRGQRGALVRFNTLLSSMDCLSASMHEHYSSAQTLCTAWWHWKTAHERARYARRGGRVCDGAGRAKREVGIRMAILEVVNRWASYVAHMRQVRVLEMTEGDMRRFMTRSRSRSITFGSEVTRFRQQWDTYGVFYQWLKVHLALRSEATLVQCRRGYARTSRSTALRSAELVLKMHPPEPLSLMFLAWSARTATVRRVRIVDEVGGQMMVLRLRALESRHVFVNLQNGLQTKLLLNTFWRCWWQQMLNSQWERTWEFRVQQNLMFRHRSFASSQAIAKKVFDTRSFMLMHSSFVCWVRNHFHASSVRRCAHLQRLVATLKDRVVDGMQNKPLAVLARMFGLWRRVTLETSGSRTRQELMHSREIIKQECEEQMHLRKVLVMRRMITQWRQWTANVVHVRSIEHLKSTAKGGTLEKVLSVMSTIEEKKRRSVLRECLLCWMSNVYAGFRFRTFNALPAVEYSAPQVTSYTRPAVPMLSIGNAASVPVQNPTPLITTSRSSPIGLVWGQQRHIGTTVHPPMVTHSEQLSWVTMNSGANRVSNLRLTRDHYQAWRNLLAERSHVSRQLSGALPAAPIPVPVTTVHSAAQSMQSLPQAPSPLINAIESPVPSSYMMQPSLSAPVLAPPSLPAEPVVSYASSNPLPPDRVLRATSFGASSINMDGPETYRGEFRGFPQERHQSSMRTISPRTTSMWDTVAEVMVPSPRKPQPCASTLAATSTAAGSEYASPRQASVTASSVSHIRPPLLTESFGNQAHHAHHSDVAATPPHYSYPRGMSSDSATAEEMPTSATPASRIATAFADGVASFSAIGSSWFEDFVTPPQSSH